MPTKRCPACQALNAEGAVQCAMCGQSLTADPKQPSRLRRVVPTRDTPQPIPAPLALGMGALVGMGVFVVGGTLTLVLAGRETNLFFLVAPPKVSIAGLPLFASWLAAGAGLGALVGGLFALLNSRWAGCFIIAPLFITLRAESLMPHNSWWWFEFWFGKPLGWVYGGAVVATAGIWGVLYALAIAGVIRAHALGLFAPRPS